MHNQVWAKGTPLRLDPDAVKKKIFRLRMFDKEGDKLCLCSIFYVEIVEKQLKSLFLDRKIF
jgi:hypothetical protein